MYRKAKVNILVSKVAIVEKITFAVPFTLNINEKQGNATECERIQKMQTQANDAKVNKSKVNEIKGKEEKEKNIKKENFVIRPEIAEAFEGLKKRGAVRLSAFFHWCLLSAILPTYQDI